MTTHTTLTHHQTTHPGPVLVIGATGKTGRRVTRRLSDLGVGVVAASRSGPTRFDWEQPATWGPALEGVRAAYVTYSPDLAIPGAEEAVDALVALARAAGVEQLVLLSGRGEPGARRCEDIVMSGLPASTVLRCAWFDQNFTEGVLVDAVLSGVLALPVDPTIGEPFLDVEDIADAAVAALLDPRHRGRRYELTGPESLTFGRVAAVLAAASGRPVRFVPVTSAEFVEGAVAAGVSREEASLLAGLFAEVLDGRNAATTDGVRQVLGRAPRDFASFAAAAARAGAWDVGEEQAS